MLGIGKGHLRQLNAEIPQGLYYAIHRFAGRFVDPFGVPPRIDRDPVAVQAVAASGCGADVVTHRREACRRVEFVASGDHAKHGGRVGGTPCHRPIWSSVAASSNTPKRLTRPRSA